MTLRSYFTLLLNISFIASLSACGNTDSENVTSKGIHADITVVSRGEGSSTVGASLTVGDDGLFNTLVKLSEGDILNAHADGLTKKMTRHDQLFDFISIVYAAEFDIDHTDAEFRVEFTRSNDAGAPNSTVSLPPGPDISAPESGHTYAKDSEIRVDWLQALSDEPITIEIKSECFDDEGRNHFVRFEKDLADQGYYIFNTFEIINSKQIPADRNIQRCDIDITVIRTRSGKLDPGYGEGGRIRAQQKRSVYVKLDQNL